MIRKFECKNCHKTFQADDQKQVLCPECQSDNVEYYSYHVPYKKIIAGIVALAIVGIGIYFMLRGNGNEGSIIEGNDITEIENDTTAEQSIKAVENTYTQETGLTIPPSIVLQGKKTLNEDDNTYSFKVAVKNPPSASYKIVLTDKSTGTAIAESKNGSFVGVPPSKAEGGIYLIQIVDTKKDSVLCTPQTMDGFLPVQKVDHKLSMADLQKMIESGDETLVGNGENPYLAPDYTIKYKGLSDGDNHPSNFADVLEKLDMGIWNSVKVESVEYDDTKHIKNITLHINK